MATNIQQVAIRFNAYRALRSDANVNQPAVVRQPMVPRAGTSSELGRNSRGLRPDAIGLLPAHPSKDRKPSIPFSVPATRRPELSVRTDRRFRTGAGARDLQPLSWRGAQGDDEGLQIRNHGWLHLHLDKRIQVFARKSRIVGRIARATPRHAYDLMNLGALLGTAAVTGPKTYIHVRRDRFANPPNIAYRSGNTIDPQEGGDTLI